MDKDNPRLFQNICQCYPGSQKNSKTLLDRMVFSFLLLGEHLFLIMEELHFRRTYDEAIFSLIN